MHSIYQINLQLKIQETYHAYSSKALRQYQKDDLWLQLF